MKLPFVLRLESKPRIQLQGARYHCFGESGPAGIGPSPEYAWAAWFEHRYPGSPNVALVRRAADADWWRRGHLMTPSQSRSALRRFFADTGMVASRKA